MALHRGIQSAIFYYVSCAPCADVKYRRQRKKEAQWDRANREAHEMEEPNLYRHPSPSSTNPYWQVEIAEGPTGTRKKRANMAESQTRLKTVPTISSAGSPMPSSLDLDHMIGGGGKYERDILPMRYQREDEKLWGVDAPDVPLASNLSGSAVTRPSTARTAGSQRSYQSSTNPTLNDLHPATTRKINAKDEVAWMLQPPPVADVMKGKAHTTRSRSDSGGSRPSAANSQRLSRQVSQRILQEKIKAGESPVLGTSAETFGLPETTTKPRGSRHKRQRSKTVGDGPELPLEDSLGPRRHNNLPPMEFSYSGHSQNSATTIGRNSFLTPDEANNIYASQNGTHKAALKPRLSPIVSNNPTPVAEDNASPISLLMTPSDAEERVNLASGIAKRDFSQKPTLYLRNNSLAALEALPTPTFGRSLAPSPTLIEAKVKLPEQDSTEEQQLEAEYTEMFDSWYTPDFDISTWVTEHTKREVRHRWSMDL